MKINYSLRPQKNIERKLILEVISNLQTWYPIPTYRYIGLGSIWFVDFRLMHEVLGIDKLISIEKHAPGRAEFNRPYACIEVIEGDTEFVLPELELSESRSIVWLDHDTDLKGPGLKDLQYAVERVPDGSVVLLTLNADHRQVKGQTTQEKLASLKQIVGNLTPPAVDEDFYKKNFPSTISTIVQSAIQHALVSSGRSSDFLLLFNYTYRDGVSMVTVGGLIDSRQKLSEIRNVESNSAANFRPEKALLDLNVPLLTHKEKIALDSLLPCEHGLSQALKTSEAGISLEEKDIEGYSRLYKYYPVYGESTVL